MPTLERSEYEDQVAVFEWAALNEYRWPCLALLFGSLMGAKLPPKYLNKYIKAGMKKGKPDIHLPVPIGGHCGLWIELKRKGERLPTGEQHKMLINLEAVGNAVYACRGSQAAINVLVDYLTGKIRRSKPPICESFDPTTKLPTLSLLLTS